MVGKRGDLSVSLFALLILLILFGKLQRKQGYTSAPFIRALFIVSNQLKLHIFLHKSEKCYNIPFFM
jgi:hypothetical protein